MVPDDAEELARVAQARSRIGTRMTSLLTHEIDRLEQLRTRPVLANPVALVDARAEELTRWVARSHELVDRVVERSLTRVGELAGQLRALSPQGTLDRGYAIAQLPSGAALRDTVDAPAGTQLLLTIATGRIRSTVDESPIES